jgi:hypothetical protein
MMYLAWWSPPYLDRTPQNMIGEVCYGISNKS